jgi:hypothetical protein
MVFAFQGLPSDEYRQLGHSVVLGWSLFAWVLFVVHKIRLRFSSSRLPLNMIVKDSTCPTRILHFTGYRALLPPVALSIRPLGRLGNSVIQLGRALAFAQLLGTQDIHIALRLLLMNHTFSTTRGIVVHNNDFRMHSRILHSLFWDIRQYRCFEYDRRLMASTFRDVFLASFPVSLANESTLYLYFRSGDVFSLETPNVYYGQPPCAYYREAEALDDRRHTSVEIVSEDRGNPCMSVFVGEGYRWDRHSLSHDMSILLYARRTAFGCGTFSYSVVDFAPVRQFLYTFEGSGGLTPGLAWSCRANPEFRRIVRSHWQNGPEQLTMIVASAGCVDWNRGDGERPKLTTARTLSTL